MLQAEAEEAGWLAVARLDATKDTLWAPEMLRYDVEKVCFLAEPAVPNGTCHSWVLGQTQGWAPTGAQLLCLTARSSSAVAASHAVPAAAHSTLSVR